MVRYWVIIKTTFKLVKLDEWEDHNFYNMNFNFGKECVKVGRHFHWQFSSSRLYKSLDDTSISLARFSSSSIVWYVSLIVFMSLSCFSQSSSLRFVRQGAINGLEIPLFGFQAAYTGFEIFTTSLPAFGHHLEVDKSEKHVTCEERDLEDVEYRRDEDFLMNALAQP